MVAKLPVRKLTLEYEWLLKDPAHFARVYAFLGLTPPATKKQNDAVKLGADARADDRDSYADGTF